jgi:hypothetical protein
MYGRWSGLVAEDMPRPKMGQLHPALSHERWAYSLKGNITMADSQKLAVFVPANPTVPIASIVVPGSAIVGIVESSELELVTVDYEGALYGPANMKTFADRARHAAGRQSVLYPTIARSVVPRSHLRQVGWFDERAGITLLDDAESREVLASWLGVETLDPEELWFSSL